MRTDIAFTYGSQNGICQCMHGHVGIRMTLQPMREWNGHTAQGDGITGVEGVNIDTLADADVGEIFQLACRHVPVGDVNILGGGELAVLGRGRDHCNGNAGMFGNRGIVGEVGRGFRLGPAVGCEDLA